VRARKELRNVEGSVIEMIINNPLDALTRWSASFEELGEGER
jgi:hypothetical protein